MKVSAAEQLPDEKEDLREEIVSVVPNPEHWLETPHPMLGLRRPLELIGSEDEQQLRDLVRALKHGMVT